MATVYRIRADPAGPTLAQAIAGYLATLDHPETAGTRRVYAGTLAALRAELGDHRPVANLGEAAAAERLTAWFTTRWGARAPATFNRNLDALRAAVRYWHDQSWLDPGADPTRSLRRRGRAPDRTKALSRDQVETLLGREDLGLRERTLWRMLYETAARAGEILALDVDELGAGRHRGGRGDAEASAWRVEAAGRAAGRRFCDGVVRRGCGDRGGQGHTRRDGRWRPIEPSGRRHHDDRGDWTFDVA